MEALVARINALPLLVALMWVGALAMLVPASYAWAIRDFADMRAFAYSGGLFLALCVLMSIVTNNKAPVWQGRNRLFHLFGAYTLLPAMLAVPVVISVGDTTFTNAYAEMVSCLTTTGAAFYDDPERLSAAVHLWRGLVAWLGGFFILVAAVAILAPLNLGGFDVLSGSSAGVTSASGDRFYSLDGGQRFLRYTFKLFPIYAGLTAVLWLLFTIETRAPMINLVHAMSILSTSGISPIAGGIGQAGGVTAEAMAMFFMIFALTRLPFNTETGQRSPRNFWSDPELRLGLLLVYLVSPFVCQDEKVVTVQMNRMRNWESCLDDKINPLIRLSQFNDCILRIKISSAVKDLT